MKFNRRHFMYLSISALGAAAVLKPGDKGLVHSPEFRRLSDALDQVQYFKPTLIVDHSKLLANISTLKNNIKDRYKYRIVGKSLPSVPLLNLVMQESATVRVMLFHQPFLTEVAREIPHADVLMGKVQPVAAAKQFYVSHGADEKFTPEKQLQWLIDTPERLSEYEDLAKNINVNMRINIEIDVGLHRGGVQDHAVLKSMLEHIVQNPQLQFSGFMGYEPHILKVPGSVLSNRDDAMALYQGYLDVVELVFGEVPDNLTLNCGGSQTYQLYDDDSFPFNELCAGSGLVKPSDFDLPTLDDHQVATYIATPVLKVMEQTQIPGVDVGKLMSFWNPNRKKTFFTYGGYWKAIPESPKGLLYSPFNPRSTNQECLHGSDSIDLKPNDWMFLRPTQSEFVFLQFEGISLYKDGEITERWPVLGQS